MAFVAPNSSGPFRSTRHDLTALGAILRDGGYNSATLSAAGLMPRRGEPELPLFEQIRRCEGGGNAEALSRVFMLGLAQPAAAIDAALQPLGIAPLIECGLLIQEGADVRAATALVPTRDLLMARDFSPNISGRPAAPDHVLNVGAASVLLLGLTVRRGGETMLDLGCGQGVQMLLGRAHASRIIGTDINPRALNIASFNMAINPLPRHETTFQVREGSFYEPVADLKQSFDLIVSNPPFVMTPAKQVAAFTSALQGDGTVEAVFRGAPEHLKDGGWCVSLGNWMHTGPNDWADRPKSWLQGSGCDALIVKMESMHPRTYAMKWIRGTGQSAEPTPAQVDDWTAMFDSLGAGAITFGFVVIRKRSGHNWVQHAELDYDSHLGPAGEQFQRIFAGRTLLHELDLAGAAASLVERTFTPAPGLRMAHRQEWAGGAWKAVGVECSQSPGIPWTLTGDAGVAQFLNACDGKTAAKAIAQRMARAANADPAAALASTHRLLRTLLERGMVEVR